MSNDTINENWVVSHRARPLPKLPWVMKQTWSNTLFIHYPIRLDVLRQLVPSVLPLDSYNGWGWIGLIAYNMEDVKLRILPVAPACPGLNVRTYVTINEKPGIYFFSLDATSLPIVMFGRTFCFLPYVHANIERQQDNDTHYFRCSRKKDQAYILDSTYRAISKPYLAEKGSFDEWLTGRYCFYTTTPKGNIIRCDILHQPWLLQHAEAEIRENTALSGQGIHVESVPPVLHYSQQVNVRIWPLLRE